MAQTVSADSVLLSIYKTWYTEKEFPNLLVQKLPNPQDHREEPHPGQGIPDGCHVLTWWGDER